MKVFELDKGLLNRMTTNVTAYAFDDFVLNIGMRTLTFRDQTVPITSKAFQTLLVLLRDHGRVVEKESFLKEVWPDTFIGESTLAQNIRTLRKAFAEFNKMKEFIVTVPRRGYRFVGNVEELSFGEDVPAPRNEEESFVKVKNSVRLTNRVTRSVKLSPDRKKLACCLWDPKTDRMTLAIVSAETGKVLAYPITPRNDDIPFLDWSSEGDNLYAVLQRAEPVSLWKIPVNGGQPTQLCEWRDALNLRLAISKDGQQFYYEVEGE